MSHPLPPLPPIERGDRADGRNQVIAGCGNGSLRLFDITLEVSLHIFLDLKHGRAGGRADS